MPTRKLETWKAGLDRMRGDAAFMAKWNALGDRRREVVPQMQAMIEDFLNDRITLEELRSTIDVNTRNEWDVFGLKGMSGAMFLNMLVRYLPDHRDEVTELLKQAIGLPENDEDARRRFARLYDRLEELIQSGVVERRRIQPSRTSFFLSAMWHIQSPQWVPYYESIRRHVAEKSTTSTRDDTPMDRYFRFLDRTRPIMSELDIDTWEFEALCSWLERQQTVDPGVETPETTVEPSASATSNPSPRVWLLAPGPKAVHWDDFYREGICGVGFEDFSDFRSFNSHAEITEALSRGPGEASPKNSALAAWEFLHHMKVGDRIYVKKGKSHIIGYGVVTSDYRYEPTRPVYRHVRSVNWTWRGEERPPRGTSLVLKTLTDITNHLQLIADLEAITGTESESDTETTLPPATPYTPDDAMRELFMEQDTLEMLLNRLRHRKNLVLQGPPGVGKTFVASRLADLLVGRRDPSHVELVQFHPSYSYEDFIQGYRPREGGGFELRNGPFLRFCDRALQDPDEPYVLIVDEINRGNLGKIFGELMMLIEPDKRDPRWGVTLAYSEEGEKPFHVPANLHIIGTMNTADRSLAMVDYALRRRFSFATIEPAFETRAFGEHLVKMGADENLLARVRSRMARVNEHIERGPGLGQGYLIGHSYFCASPEEGSACDDSWYEQIIDLEIEPLLREYWFADRTGSVDKIIEELRE